MMTSARPWPMIMVPSVAAIDCRRRIATRIPLRDADRAANAQTDQKADESPARAVDRIGGHEHVREGHDAGDREVEALRDDDEAFAGGGDGEGRRIVGEIGHARHAEGARIPERVEREKDHIENGDDARAVGQAAADRYAQVRARRARGRGVSARAHAAVSWIEWPVSAATMVRSLMSAPVSSAKIRPP